MIVVALAVGIAVWVVQLGHLKQSPPAAVVATVSAPALAPTAQPTRVVPTFVSRGPQGQVIYQHGFTLDSQDGERVVSAPFEVMQGVHYAITWIPAECASTPRITSSTGTSVVRRLPNEVVPFPLGRSAARTSGHAELELDVFPNTYQLDAYGRCGFQLVLVAS